SIEIVKISLGMDYDIYVNEYIEELTKFTFGLEADERAQGSIYDYVQARMKEEGVPEPENLDLLINYVVEHKKVTSGEKGDERASGSLNEYLQKIFEERDLKYKSKVVIAEISEDYGILGQYVDTDVEDIAKNLGISNRVIDYDKKIKILQGRRFIEEYYEQDPLKLSNVDLSGCVFSNVVFYKSLNGATLRDCVLNDNVIFSACDLSNADFRGSKLNCEFRDYLLADGELPDGSGERLLESVKLDYSDAQSMQMLKLFRIEAQDKNPLPSNERTFEDYDPIERSNRENEVIRRYKFECEDEINRFKREKLATQGYVNWARSFVVTTEEQKRLQAEIQEGTQEIQKKYAKLTESALFVIANEYIIELKTANYDPTYLPKNSEQANAIKVRLKATQQDLEEYISKGKKSSFNEFLSTKPENEEILRQAEIMHPNKLVVPVGDFFYEGKSYQTITGLNLSKLDLSGVNFARVTFKDCQFDGTNLTGASFETAVLKDSSFVGAELTDANLIGLFGDNINFTKALMPRVRMMYSNFNNSNFEGALLYSADLMGSNIENSSLKKAIADRADLERVNLRYVDAQYVKMRKAHLKKAVLDGDFSYADLTGAVMEGITANKAKFTEAVLEDANLKYANLRGAILEKIKAKGVDLSHADLESAKLELADLSKAIMDDVSARFTDFQKANMQDVHAHQADFSHAVMENIKGERLDVSGAILEETKLRNANLTEAVLENIAAYKANFQGAILNEVNAKFAEMIACDFSDAIARNMDVSGAKLPMCHMERTDCTGMKFDYDTLLLDVNFRDAVGAEALIELQEKQHLIKDQLFGRSAYGYCRNNVDGSNDRFKCQRIGAALLSSVIGGGAGYTLSGPFAGIAGSVVAGLVSDRALYAVKEGYFKEQGYISNQLGDKLAELGAIAIATGAGSLEAGVNAIPIAATLCAATGLISPSSVGATIGGALSTYAGINILKQGFAEQSYTKKIIGGTLTGMGAIATYVGLSSLGAGFNMFAGTLLCGATAGGLHGGIFAYKQLRDYDEDKKTGMRPEEIYTVSIQKGEESFKKLWPTKNKFICALVFAALAVSAVLMLNPISAGFGFITSSIILANASFAVGAFGFTCGYLYDEKLSFWNNISFDGIKAYFQQPSHGKQLPKGEVSKAVEGPNLSQGYIIDQPEQFTPIKGATNSKYFSGIDVSIRNDFAPKHEVIKDPIDQFVERQTEICMEKRNSEVARRIIDEKILPPLTPHTPEIIGSAKLSAQLIGKR
ncbi:MAG: pentapeptide repeat-containing protein, partial [Proteobacteria bacterium]|nr:pentapeptide repeat-containing protein [Pseudomonadota bacterium]